jgi:hypothetical protein
VIALPLLLPSGHVVYESQLRHHCEGNLKQIMLAMSMYTHAFDGHYPDKGLGQLAAANILSSGRVYQCPTSLRVRYRAPLSLADLKGGLSDYVYLGAVASDAATRLQPIVHDAAANHNPAHFSWWVRRQNADAMPWINVGFSDGSVQGFPAEFWDALAQEKGW